MKIKILDERDIAFNKCLWSDDYSAHLNETKVTKVVQERLLNAIRVCFDFNGKQAEEWSIISVLNKNGNCDDGFPETFLFNVLTLFGKRMRIFVWYQAILKWLLLRCHFRILKNYGRRILEEMWIYEGIRCIFENNFDWLQKIHYTEKTNKDFKIS